MSWLYSLVFAGLLFSSQNGTAPSNLNTSANANTAAAEAGKQDETERFEQSYPLNANGRVSVSNINGSIIVEAWDKNEVHLEAVKTADSKETLSEVELRIDSKPDSFSVETNYDNWRQKNRGDWGRNRKLEVQFHLSVPRGAVLDEVETVNGSVTVSNFSNYTKISAVNGNVNAANLRGTANLSTVNGEVAADFDRLETGSKISLSTVNGRVNLTIPSDSNATLRADSVNGEISNTFGLPVRKGQYVGRDLYGRLGGGDVHIKLSSVNGPLSVGHKNDGRTPAPATNLLPQKNKDDQDWDDSDNDTDTDNENSAVNTAKINREAARSVRQAQKDQQKAIVQAQREVQRTQPEIAKINSEALKKAAEAISSVDIEASVKAGLEAQRDTLMRIRDINLSSALPSIEKKSDSIAVKGIPKVSIEAKGCGVSVRGWDKQEVHYVVTHFSDSRHRDPMIFTEDHSDSTVNIKVTNPDKDAANGDFTNDLTRLHIEVFVPKKSNLKISSNGAIRLEGVSGDMELTGADEAINVRDADGKMILANTGGLIRLIGFRGQLDAKTGNGDMFLEGDFDRLTANAADGTVVLTVPDATNATIMSNTDVEAEGINITHDGNTWKLGKGGAKYNFNFDGGKLVVKNLSQIESY
jgi:hypothetical protein